MEIINFCDLASEADFCFSVFFFSWQTVKSYFIPFIRAANMSMVPVLMCIMMFLFCFCLLLYTFCTSCNLWFLWGYFTSVKVTKADPAPAHRARAPYWDIFKRVYFFLKFNCRTLIVINMQLLLCVFYSLLSLKNRVCVKGH